MAVLLLFLLILGVAQCQEFLDTPPPDYTTGNGFRDCASRFSKTWKIPVTEALGGVRAYQGEFQHMAAIGWTRTDGTIDYLCGGSLITWRFILTAAHCAVDYRDLPPDTVRLGDTDLGSPDDDESAQQVSIARFIKHPQYRESKKYYDIALVELVKNVTPNDPVCVACLWREPEAPSGMLQASGFGALGFGEMLSPTLQKVQLRALDKTSCGERIPTNRRQMPEGLRADQLCASSDTMDTCEGDSGGPLQTELHDVFGNVYPLVIGVVSFGTPCIVGSTGVYTRVSTYLDWIEKEVNQSLSYSNCTGIDLCDRKKNPSISAEVKPRWPINRVGLLWKQEETDVHQCGGLLIDYQYVLTSADCVTSSRGPPKFVASSSYGDRASVANVFVHPEYERERASSHDIALIRLNQYANLEETQPVCPWMKNEEAEANSLPLEVPASIPQRRFRMNQYTNSSRQYILQSVERDQCTTHQDGDANDLICIMRNISLVPDTCQVDYGGPVMTEVAKNKYRVHGVMSRRTEGCGSNVIYIDITPHLQWLESIMFKNLNEWLVFTD
ncbi:polyserase-2-like [Anopheles maculipalpis]|uniref:polyserase-2-like n=1 Tax=Anopheles maculipalpis TaxID=1496333 RepID=UPI0021592160|nr:polyserase-2-like [Anopheles maculipalpis]